MPKGNPGVPKSADHTAKMRVSLLGKPKSEAHKAALRKPKSDAHRRALSVAITPAVVEKRRATMLARYGVNSSKADPLRNQNRVEYWIARGMQEDSARELISKAQKSYSALKKNHSSLWQISYWESQGLSTEEARQRVSEIQTRNSIRSSCTISMASTVFLDNVQEILGVPIEREVPLLDKFKVDGLIDSNVIEYFGSFWHMHPDDFMPDDIHRVTGWTAKAKWAEDRGRIRLLEKNGFRVFVIWDREATPETAAMIAKEIQDARRKR